VSGDVAFVHPLTAADRCTTGTNQEPNDSQNALTFTEAGAGPTDVVFRVRPFVGRGVFSQLAPPNHPGTGTFIEVVARSTSSGQSVPTGSWVAVKGAITVTQVGETAASGSLEADLVSDAEPSMAPSVHISGTWICQLVPFSAQRP